MTPMIALIAICVLGYLALSVAMSVSLGRAIARRDMQMPSACASDPSRACPATATPGACPDCMIHTARAHR